MLLLSPVIWNRNFCRLRVVLVPTRCHRGSNLGSQRIDRQLGERERHSGSRRSPVWEEVVICQTGEVSELKSLGNSRNSA